MTSFLGYYDHSIEFGIFHFNGVRGTEIDAVHGAGDGDEVVLRCAGEPFELIQIVPAFKSANDCAARIAEIQVGVQPLGDAEGFVACVMSHQLDSQLGTDMHDHIQLEAVRPQCHGLGIVSDPPVHVHVALGVALGIHQNPILESYKPVRHGQTGMIAEPWPTDGDTAPH